MSAAIHTYVHDQRIAVVLDQKRAMELGVAFGAHVWDVDVADSTVGGFVDFGSVGLDPIAVARWTLVPEGLDGDRSWFLLIRPASGDHHFTPGEIDQPFTRTHG